MRPTKDPRREAGTTIVEAVFTVTATFAVFLGIFQYCLYAHAQGLAHQAAVTAVSETRRQGGTPEAGQAAGAGFLDSSTSLLRGANISTGRTATTATATVTGTVWSFLPWQPGGLLVREEVTAPVERWVPR
ncbi:hypothetical protein ABH924_003319 [Arthrobacter sp. GAS37]|uniref:TadE/TadG family type IV pilus assembly protein n=1 Tax=Arthrobacter sp. GAS37 TaxID=3156261 RepID=UPI003838F231